MSGRVQLGVGLLGLVLALAGLAQEGRDLRVAVTAEGPCRIAVDTLAAQWGLPSETVRQALEAGEVALFQGGNPVSWRREGTHLLFFGRRNPSLYSAFTSYRVSLKTGRQARVGPAAEPVDAAAEPVGRFPDTVRLESNLYCSIQRDGWSDAGWMCWQFIAPNGTYNFPCAVPDPSPDQGGVRLDVALRSLHPEGFMDSHRMRVSWQGGALGEAAWDGQGPRVWSGRLAAGAAPAGTLSIRELTGDFAGRGALDWIDITYDRLARARDDRLLARPDRTGPFVCSGFTTADVAVWDVTDPLDPVVLPGLEPVSRPEGYAVGFQAVSGRQYAVFSVQAVPGPSSIRPDAALDLASATNAADWVAVTPFREWADLSAGAADLADFRSRQGLRARVVTAEAIADTFGDGICDPPALSAFVRATARWAVRPRYMVLVGYGSQDYRRESTKTQCLLPTPAIPVSTSVFMGEIGPGDATYGDDNGDGLPEVVIGRIPSMTPAELAEAVGKIKAYEAAAACKTNALFCADNPTNGVYGNLHQQADDAAAWAAAAGYQVRKQYVPADTLDSSGLQAPVLDALSKGVGLFFHLGHGDAWQLGYRNGFLHAAGLRGAQQQWAFPPIALLPSCWINRFNHPTYPDALCLEAFRQPGTGFAAIWSPACLVDPRDGDRLGRAMMAAWAEPDSLRLGDAVRRAAAIARPGMETPAVLGAVVLLGDPATVIRFDQTAWGTPQAWLRDQGLSAPNADTMDVDGDTFPAWLEYREGTDPLRASEHPLRIGRARHEEGRFALTFVSAPGIKYRVKVSGALGPDAEWTPVAVSLTAAGDWREWIPATGTETTLYVEPGEGTRFFKIEGTP